MSVASRWASARHRISVTAASGGVRPRRTGLRVDHSPQVGAALSFLPGQEGASSPWGHVAVVEQVNGNSILISESNVAGLYTITYRTLYNPGRFWYVH